MEEILSLVVIIAILLIGIIIKVEKLEKEKDNDPRN